jgi:PadR family transcriptional regulator AphA
MSLRYALLGFLDLDSMTGYELKKNLDRSTQLFWYAGLNQIYPTLKKLESDRLVTSELEPQDGKPDRRTYRITPEGRDLLRSWLAEPLTSLPPGKNAGLLKLFFAGSLEKEIVLRQLQAQLELHRKQLARYEGETRQVIEEIVGATGLTREGSMWELVRELGEEHERTYVRWLERAIEQVEGAEWDEALGAADADAEAPA